MAKVEQRLAEMGVALPTPAAPIANYVPFVRSGDLVHISGQVSRGAPDAIKGDIKGVVGETVDLAQAQAAARLCAVHLIAPDEGGVRRPGPGAPGGQARRLRAGGGRTSSRSRR